jgi:uncharacterized protein YxeA
MKTIIVKLIAVLIILTGTVSAIEHVESVPLGTNKPQDPLNAADSDQYTVSGPHTYENLAVYLIHGKDKIKDTKFTTLQDALKQKKVTVFETGTVNTLMVDNTSDDVYIYIHSGDIVRGGKQDRTVGYDYIIPPKSGKMPLDSFCVESGRWQKRGNELAEQFSVSDNLLSSRELKLAAKYRASQPAVWAEVKKTQDKLGDNLGKSVRSHQSASSLELTLEDKEVKKTVQEYVDALSSIVQDNKDVVGFAFAINGKINSAEVYASNNLFRKLWPKLLQASSVEALAELQETNKFNSPPAASVTAFLKSDEKAKVSDKQINEQIKMVTRESKNKIEFETYRTGEQQALHKSYFSVDPNSLKQTNQNTRSENLQQQIQGE